MTDEEQIKQQAVDAIVKGVAKKTAIILLIAVVIALLMSIQRPGNRWLLPCSILFGGILGLLNFRWLATAVQRLYLKQGTSAAGAKTVAAVVSILKLSLIFIVLFIVISLRLVHILGMVAGLSLCFFAILWEGMTLVRNIRSG